MGMADFYGNIYNTMPAHTEDIHAAIIDNPEISAMTPAGGERRKANAIAINDVLKLKAQASFFPMLFGAGANRAQSNGVRSGSS